MSQQHFLSSSGTRRSDYWIATAGESGFESAEDLVLDSSGNLYICGLINNSCFISKYTPLGINKWTRTLDRSTGTGQWNGITIDSSDNLYVCGETSSTGQGSDDLIVAKYDTSGNVQWQKVLGGTSVDQGKSVGVDSLGNVYVAGTTRYDGDYHPLLVKYDNNGNLQWQRTLNTTNTNQSYGVAFDNSDNIYITGNLSSGAGFGFVYGGSFLAKYNGSGDLIFCRVLDVELLVFDPFQSIQEQRMASLFCSISQLARQKKITVFLMLAQSQAPIIQAEVYIDPRRCHKTK